MFEQNRRRGLSGVTGIVVIALASICAAAHAAGPSHGGGSAPHAGAGLAASGGAHQHFDNHFAHNQYYYDRGYSVGRPPPGGREFHGRDGGRYWYHGGNWYRYRGGSWVVWGAPLGIFVPVLPPYFTTVWWYGIPYYYANDTYYVWDDAQRSYEVVAPPDGIDASGTNQPPPSDQLFIYPKSGQSPEQQSRDRYECHRWAVEQTGFDPAAPGGGVPAQQAIDKRNDYFRAQVSCLEGRGYSVK